MSEPMPASREVAERLRAFRIARRMTTEQMARLLTEHEYPITRSALANVENMRFKTLPVDLLYCACEALQVSQYQFYSGPLCNGCQDDPPTQFICKVCGRTRDADGELVRC